MSWETFQDDAFNLTKVEIKALSREVVTQYRLAIKSIEDQLDKVYADILSGVSPDDYYNTMIKRNRLQALLNQTREDYIGFSRTAGIKTRQSISLGFSNVYYRKAYTTNWLVSEYTPVVLPKSLIELTTLGTKTAWDNIKKGVVEKYGKKINYIPREGTLSSLLVNNRTTELAKIQSALTQGFISGSSKTSMMTNIKNIIGNELIKNKQLTLSGAKASAMRIVRTETNRTMNLGSYAQSKAADSEGVEIEREMVAVLDNKTRAQSAGMDGQRVGIDEPFVYPGNVRAMTPGTTGVKKFDINDRETVIDIVNGESPKIRRGRNPETGKNEVFEYKSFDTWAKDNNLTKNKYGEIVAK